MTYTVTYTPFAEYQLADIWLRAKNRQQVTDAADQIEAMLRSNAEGVGRLRPDGLHSVIKPPLGYTFEVMPDDCMVKVVSIRYLPTTKTR
jgi:hypothetical protein